MRYLLFAMMLAGTSALAADYRLDPGASVQDGTLQVKPTVRGPAGAALEYEIETRKLGASGSSNSSQSGSVRLDDEGRATLATTSVSVAPRDRYRVQVKLLEDGRVVAQKEVRFPD